MMKHDANNKIILSVIIPTCNRNNTLLRAIYSVLNQNIEELEIIVVNDTENPITHDIINIAKYNPVIFTTNPGKHGAASARNYGVSIAKGKYITFLDDDDMYLPGRLSNNLNYMLRGNYVMVSSGRFYETGDFTTIKPEIKQCFGEVTLQDIQYQNDIDIGFMMKRETFIYFNGFDDSYKSLEDWDLIIRVLGKGICYKVERMDYAVNLDLNRSRVSDSDSVSYLKIADMYKGKFGGKWHSLMIIRGLRLSGNLSIYFTISTAIRYATFIPITEYLRQLKCKCKRLIC